jgi:hypothetical protein
MVRRPALALSLAAALATATVALAKKKATEAEPKQPLGLHLRAVDLGHRLILLEVDGFAKPPPSNFFTMTDDRGHHYIAQTIHCDPPFPSGTRSCELEIPAGYERHPMTGLELHVRGLNGRTITVPPEEVKAAWVAAETAHAPPTSESPPRDGGVLDSSVPQTDLGK